MFLLDTNVVSELRKAKPQGAVLAWYRAQPVHAFFIPSIVLYEIQAGVEITRQKDVAKAKEIEGWLDQMASEATVLDLDAASARLVAKLLHGRPLEFLEDAMIAAIAGDPPAHRRDEKHQGFQTVWCRHGKPLFRHKVIETGKPRRIPGLAVGAIGVISVTKAWERC